MPNVWHEILRQVYHKTTGGHKMAPKKQAKKKEDTDLAGINMKLSFDDFLKKYVNAEAREDEVVPTGIIPMDILLSGGIREGDMIMIYSPEGLGKTTLVLHMARRLMEQYGKKVLFIDVEAGLANMIESQGMLPYIDKGLFNFVDELQTVGHLEKILEGLVKQDVPAYDVVIIDSITNVLDDSVLTRSVIDPMMCGQAKAMTSFLQKFRVLLRKAGITTFLVNQERANIEAKGPYDKKTKSAGCKALHYQPDVIISLKKDSGRTGGADMMEKRITLEGEKDVPVGCYISAKADKNRKGFSKIPIVFPLIFTKGVSNIYFLVDLLKSKGYIKSAGAYWKTEIIPNPAGGEWSLCGMKSLYKWVKDNFAELDEFLKNDGAYTLVHEKTEEDIVEEDE